MSNAYVAPATTDAATKVSLNKKSVSLTVAQDGEKISYGTATLKVKKGKKVCSNCFRDIVGNIYRSVISIDENIYCEKCSFTKKEPTFIIQ